MFVYIMVKYKKILQTAPGVLTFTGEIKTALVDDHHEAFYWWWDSKLKGATLFHVDGHDDMSEAVVDYKIKSAEDYAQLNIANFICPAVNHGIISSIYWFNPHSEKRLQYLGKPITSFSERDGILEEQDYAHYGWGFFEEKRIWQRNGELMAADKINVPSDLPLILDIDLDAFCCHRNSSIGRSEKYEGVFGFENRVDQTIEVLTRLPRPNLITIAHSQGDETNRCYVPPSMVNDVSSYLALNLRKLYENK